MKKADITRGARSLRLAEAAVSSVAMAA